MPNSLRSRLVLAIGALQVVTWLAILGVGGLHMWRELEEGYNIELTQFGLSVGAMVDAIEARAPAGLAGKEIVANSPDTIDPKDLPHGISASDFRDHLVQVSNGGMIIFRSPTAPATALDLPAGIKDVAIAGANWKALSQIDRTTGNRVIVAISRHEVDTTIIATLFAVLVPLAGAGLVSTLLTSYLVARLLKPLEAWANRIGEMSPYDSGPIDDREALTEVRPVLSALNRMLGRVRDSIAFERRFVRDAAHELRTPLTAVRTQIEGGDWSGLSAEQQSRMKKVKFGLARATRLVNQLMDLARAEEPPSSTKSGRVEVGAMVRAKLTEIINSAAIADPTRVSLEATDDRMWMSCNPGDAEIVLNNLLDNAIKYAGPRAEIAVALSHDESHCRLTVEDDGPGIPADKRGEVFKRFVRLEPTAAPGSGLGLALVQEIVTKLGGKVTLGESQALGGLKVTVTMPIEAYANDDVAALGPNGERVRAAS